MTWTLIVSIWFAGKLTFAPPLTYSSEADCRGAGKTFAADLARDHVTPAAIRFSCLPSRAR